MIEEFTNLWATPAAARCITTNGFVKRNGEGVMGAGCAKEAATYDPTLPITLGSAITRFGNTVTILRHRPPKPALVSFPVKHHWIEEADLHLISESAKALSVLASRMGWDRVLVPRPGCGNGRLRWTDVAPVLSAILDDRFVIVHVRAKARS